MQHQMKFTGQFSQVFCVVGVFLYSTVFICEEQEVSPHSSGFSSELSPQSSSPSHFQPRGLHRVLLHWNSSRGQYLPTLEIVQKEEGKNINESSHSSSVFFSHLQLQFLPLDKRPCVYYHQCRISPRRCRPCSLHRRHSASGRGCSGRSCTGTDRCHTSHRSRSESRGPQWVFFYSCDTAEIWPVEELTLPRLNRRHNHGPRHTSIARQCSDHWCRRTRSPNTAVALGRKQDNSWHETERRHWRADRAERRGGKRRGKGKDGEVQNHKKQDCLYQDSKKKQLMRTRGGR